MGIFAANFKASPRIWNGSLTNANGACNSDAQPLELVHIAQSRRSKTVFLKRFNKAPDV